MQSNCATVGDAGVPITWPAAGPLTFTQPSLQQKLWNVLGLALVNEKRRVELGPENGWWVPSQRFLIYSHLHQWCHLLSGQQGTLVGIRAEKLDPPS